MRHRISSSLILIFSLLNPTSLIAVDNSTSSTNLFGPNFVPPAAPGFNSQATQGLVGLLSGCMSPVLTNALSNLGKLFQGKSSSAGSFLLNAQCPKVPIPSEETLGCDRFQFNEKFSSAKVREKKKTYEEALESVQCKQDKLNSLQAQIQCLDQDAKKLAAEVQTLQSAYLQNMQQYQQDVVKMDALMTDRESQLGEVLTRLNGNSATGEKGLLATYQETQKTLDLLNDGTSGVSAMRANIRKAQLERVAFTEKVEKRKVTETLNCFQRPSVADTCNGGAPLLCEAGGAPVSPYDFLICRFSKNKQVIRGQIQRDHQSVQKAETAKQTAKDLLSALAADASIRSPGEILSKYDRSVRSLTQDWDPDFFSCAIKNCSLKTESAVTDLKKSQDPDIGVGASAALKEMDKQNETAARNLLQKAADQYEEALSTLVGAAAHALKPAACMATPDPERPELALANEMQCLEDLRKNLQVLQSGSDKSSHMNMTISAKDPSNIIHIPCAGLFGCKKAYAGAATWLGQEKQRIETFKKAYIQTANQNVETMTNQMAQTLSGKSQLLYQAQSQINQALAGIDVGASIQFTPIEAEELELNDASGLYKIPKNVLGLVGSKIPPPLPQTGEKMLGDAMSAVKETSGKLEEKSGQIMGVLGELNHLLQACVQENDHQEKQDLEKKASKLQEHLPLLDDCDSLVEFCNKSNKDLLNLLAKNLDAIERNSFDLSLGDLDAFAGALGVKRLCTKKGTATGESFRLSSCNALVLRAVKESGAISTTVKSRAKKAKSAE